MNSIINTTGRNIKISRISRGLTQMVLAKKIPMDQAYLSRIERGVQEPSLEMLGKIARALGCDPSELMKGREEGMDTSSALVPVLVGQPHEQHNEQNIVIERQEGETIIRYILPPTAQTYEFLAEQLNKSVSAERLDIPDKAVVVTNTAHNSKNCNNVTVGTRGKGEKT